MKLGIQMSATAHVLAVQERQDYHRQSCSLGEGYKKIKNTFTVIKVAHKIDVGLLVDLRKVFAYKLSFLFTGLLEASRAAVPVTLTYLAPPISSEWVSTQCSNWGLTHRSYA